MSFRDKLASMQTHWENGKDAIPGVPDGSYNLQLQSAKLKNSKASGKLMVERQHVVLDGEFQGEVITDFVCIETDQGPRELATWAVKMGYEAPAQAVDIEGTVTAIANDSPCYVADVKKSDGSDLRNVRIKNLIDAPVPSAANAKPKPAAAKTAAPAAKAAAPAARKQEVPAAELEAEASGEVGVGTAVTFKDDAGTERSAKITEVREGGSFYVEADDNQDVFELTPDQFTVNEGGGEEAAAEEGESEEDAALRTDLIALCQAHEIEVTEESTLDELKEQVGTFEWNADTLAAEEIAILEKAGAEVKKAAPAPVKKTPPPAAAKKTVAAPAPKKAVAPAKKTVAPAKKSATPAKKKK